MRSTKEFTDLAKRESWGDMGKREHTVVRKILGFCQDGISVPLRTHGTEIGDVIVDERYKTSLRKEHRSGGFFSLFIYLLLIKFYQHQTFAKLF